MGRGRSAVTPSRASVLAAGHAVVFSLFFSFLFLFSLFKSLISSAFNSTKGETAADGERGAPVGRTQAPSARGTPPPQAAGISCGGTAGPLRLQHGPRSRRDPAGRLRLTWPLYTLIHVCFPRDTPAGPRGQGESRPGFHPAVTRPSGAAPWPEPEAPCVCSWAPSRGVGAAGGGGLPYQDPSQGLCWDHRNPP